MILTKERLRLSNVTKKIDETVMLDHVFFKINEGESVGLYYTRYQPKETLLNLISGKIPFDSGSVYWNETLITGNLIRENQSIFVLNCHCSLIEDLSIEENLFIVRKHRQQICFPNLKSIHLRSKHHLNELGLGHLSPAMKISDLTFGEKKIIELLRAQICGACLFVINDTISTLDSYDYKLFKKTLHYFQNQGVSILISDSHFACLEAFSNRIVFLDHSRLLNFSQKNIHQFMSLRQLFGDVADAEIPAPFLFNKDNYRLPVPLSGGQLIEICSPDTQAYELYQNLLRANPCLNSNVRKHGALNTPQTICQFISFDIHTQLFDFLSPTENLILPYYPKLSKGILLSERRINIILQDFHEWYGADFLQKKKMSDLSLQEKLGILIYRYRLSGIKVLFCVDPRNGFDIKTHSHILSLLRRLTQCCEIDVCLLTSVPHEHIPNCDHYINITNSQHL